MYIYIYLFIYVYNAGRLVAAVHPSTDDTANLGRLAEVLIPKP